MSAYLEIMAMPFLACLVLTGIHAYLGLHILKRQVIFVDLALAQIAVLGAGIALLAGYDFHSSQAFIFSLIFTVIGAGLFALTRFEKYPVPHEAIIGVIYVVSAALLLIVLSFSGTGTEHIRESLAGSILLVRPREVLTIFLIYSAIGVIHFIFREQFWMISSDAQAAFKKGLNVRGWDFLFYATLGVVVTSSVKIAGVLLVFSFLVIPAACAMVLYERLNMRLISGWLIGTLGSVIGISISYYFDLPTGETVVCMLGLQLVMAGLLNKK